MCDELGRRFCQRPHAPNNVNELTQAFQQEWNDIPKRVHRNMCTSMRRRVQAVIQNNGAHTHYCADVDV